jgi:CheY-like chemotaxis protein
VIKASPSRDAGPAERPRVLLADDHQAMLALMADALGGECLVVGSVADGYELLAEAERLHPDVIVPDITMPRFDGIEAAHQLRRSQRPARLVFLTVQEDADYARAAFDADPPSGQRLPIALHLGHRAPRRSENDFSRSPSNSGNHSP